MEIVDRDHNKYLTNLVFSVRTVSYGSSFFSSTIYGPRASRLSHKSMGEKTRSVTYGTDLELGQ